MNYPSIPALRKPVKKLSSNISQSLSEITGNLFCTGYHPICFSVEFSLTAQVAHDKSACFAETPKAGEKFNPAVLFYEFRVLFVYLIEKWLALIEGQCQHVLAWLGKPR
jgi:hypothetical protein